MPPKVTDTLRGMDIFEHLSEPDLLKISKLLKERKFSEGQLLFKQGDRGDSLFIITEGRVKIFITDQFGRERVLAFLGEGEFFGDMALLSGTARSATAQATSAVRILLLRKDEFDQLLATNVDVMKEMLRVVAQRTATSNQRASQEASAEAGKTQGLVTAVFSPRGGAGTSTIATNLALALTQMTPDRVALVDLDLLFGQSVVMLNVQPRTTLGQASPAALASMDKESFNYYLNLHEESSLRVLVGASKPEEGELVTGDHVRAVISLLRRLFVHVVIDTAGNFSDATLAALEGADKVLMVSTPEFTTLRDVRECQRIFFDLLGFPRGRFTHVLNHPYPYKGVPTEQVVQVLEDPLAAEIPFGGDGPALAALTGAPYLLKSPSTPTSRAITGIARDINRVAQEALALAGQ